MRASTPVALTLVVAAGAATFLGMAAPAPKKRPAAPADKPAKGPIPADRMTTWNPGLNSVGGIPNRTVVFKTLQPNGDDDTKAIQTALQECPPQQVVLLGPGTFKIYGDGLAITRSNVVLRGSGPDKTVLEKHGPDMPVIMVGLRWFKYSSPIILAADAPKGATSVTLASNPGYNVGELLILNQVSDDTRSDIVTPVRKVFWGTRAPLGSEARGWFAENNRPIGQVVEVASVNGNQVSFTTPLHLGFEMALQAHLVRISDEVNGPPVPAVKYSGIEDLAVKNGDGGDGGGNIHFFAAAYCWMKNVESSLSIGHSCTVMFFGAINYFPNVDGLPYLLREVWPLLEKSHPKARLKIVGQYPTPEILAFQGPRVEVTGKVEDLRPHLSSAAVTVVPLRVGGGTRFKILEAMAMGRPVVSTSLGAEGISAQPGTDILLADDAQGFAAAVGRVLDDAVLGGQLGARGRALVQRRYSWEAASGRLERFFFELLEKRRSGAAEDTVSGQTH